MILKDKCTLASVIFFISVKTVLPEDDFASEWFSKVSDPKFQCSASSYEDTEPSDDPNVQEIYKIAKDCKELDARWDYNFKSKSKVKKNGMFEGVASISMAENVKRDLRPEHNNYKFGFRYNKCIIPFDQNIKKISGRFVNDKLEGHVRVDFHSGSFALGYAKGSKFVGTLRWFGEDRKLLKLEYVGKQPSKQSQEEPSTVLLLIQDEYKMKRLLTQQSSLVGRTLLTDNFQPLISCEQESEEIFHQCYVIEKVRSKINDCSIDLKQISQPESDAKKTFSWNLKSDHKVWHGQSKFKECSPEWETEAITDGIRKWIKSMENDKSDPFWAETFENREPWIENSEGLPSTISLRFPDLQGRNFASDPHYGIKITTQHGDSLKIVKENWTEKDRMEFVAQTKSNDWLQTLDIEGRLINFNTDNPLLRLKEPSNKNFYVQGKIRNGQLHGNVRRFGRYITDSQSLCSTTIFSGLSFVGRYDNGQITGPMWRFVVGNGAIYGIADENGRLTGKRIAFIYPDLETVYLGEFDNGIMVKGQQSAITGYRCVNGILELKFSEPSGPFFHFKAPTNETFGDQPLLTDILDDKYIIVKESKVEHEVADEGAFATRDIPKSTTITLYSGMYFTKQQIELYNNRTAAARAARNATADDMWYDSKYHGSMPECQGATITIPAHLGSMDSYRATLGHKLNHQFKPNCAYGGVLDSPRFGFIRAFFTLRDIKKGEELFINYGYSTETGPKWYTELYKKMLESGEIETDVPKPNPFGMLEIDE
ncbi:hypothetical protein TCAL_03641 [Tigriopus californicus]|uniref:SET domain-containing protein n=1 Tax=Tigriopus californicus TaxID=6832 RepID=A0A553NFX2_TIGCA|nr:uncharacterized protein LOC131888279 [Tigriopus californicus]TRY64354.1 hypothetical protein TCAL_03641 [Tigriopus californicus]